LNAFNCTPVILGDCRLKDQDQYVSSIEVASSHDGHVTQLHFVRSNGMTTFVNFPTSQTASLMANLEQALSLLVPPRNAAARRDFLRVAAPTIRDVESVRATTNASGDTISFLTTSGMRLEFALDPGLLHEAIACLRAIEDGLSKLGNGTPIASRPKA
jgi:hypothetical protein